MGIMNGMLEVSMFGGENVFSPFDDMKDVKQLTSSDLTSDAVLCRFGWVKHYESKKAELARVISRVAAGQIQDAEQMDKKAEELKKASEKVHEHLTRPYDGLNTVLKSDIIDFCEKLEKLGDENGFSSFADIKELEQLNLKELARLHLVKTYELQKAQGSVQDQDVSRRWKEHKEGLERLKLLKTKERLSESA